MNLAELLAALSDLDEAASVEFDPAQIVGDLKDKVDAIHAVLGRLDSESDRLSGIASQFTKASNSVANNRKRLEAYLLRQMQENGFEKLPGTIWRAQLQKKPPALIVEREANAEDAVQLPALVVRTISYRWDKGAVKELLSAGGEFKYGKIQQDKTVRFWPNKGEA